MGVEYLVQSRACHSDHRERDHNLDRSDQGHMDEAWQLYSVYSLWIGTGEDVNCGDGEIIPMLI